MKILSDIIEMCVKDNGVSHMVTSAERVCPKINKLAFSPAKDEFVGNIKQSYAKISGLRSMQHIKGAEREIIEMYRNELTHDIWGDADKLKKWAENKIEELAAKKYPSKYLEPEDIIDREEGVRAWYDAIKSSYLLKYDNFNRLKVMKFVTENLKPDNKAAIPPLNIRVLEDAVFDVKRKGVSFKKTYINMMRKFDTMLNVKTDNVDIGGIKGKWYSVHVPGDADAASGLGFFNKIKEYVSILSQGSNWCLRTPKSVGKDFSNCDIHIFLDNKGKPQLCLTTASAGGKNFRFIRGNNQYAPIPDKYKPILQSFLEKHKRTGSLVGLEESKMIPVTELLR